MNCEQEIRAAAAQAVAAMCATPPSLIADFVLMAEVVEAYIRDGRAAALDFCLAETPQEEAPAPGAVQADVPAPLTQVPPEVPPPAPEEATPPSSEPQQDADVIPLAARGAVSPKQEKARRIIEKRRKERVDSLVAQATVAKARAHKQRLYDEAEESQLLGYDLVINGEPTTLGTYLSSLLGS